MDVSVQDRFAGSSAGGYEETLRLIASLPAPEGLAERMQAKLAAAPRKARVLSWPEALRPASGWMRAVAAAAIVFVVVGGGWSVSSRVQTGAAARGIALPHVVAPGGFAGAGAMRTPQTLNGPVVSDSEKAEKAVVKATTAAPHQAKQALAGRNSPKGKVAGQANAAAK